MSGVSKRFLLCKRAGEADFDQVFSFPGGKVEQGDRTILAGMVREISEELGDAFRFDLVSKRSFLVEYVRKDGAHMTLPHFFATCEEAPRILLNRDEYSDFCWATLGEIASMKVIENVTEICAMHPSLAD